jgi:AraC-like DNA-binding protein
MSISAIFVRPIVEAVERAGVPREALFAGTDVDADCLTHVEHRFDISEFARLQTRALDLTRDEALGLHIAEHATEASFDLIAHLVAHSPTLRDGLSVGLQFQRIAIDDARLTLRETGAIATLDYQFARSTERSDRMHAEFIMVGLLRMLRMLAGPSGVALSAGFEHPRPMHHREYTRIFGGVERFAQQTTRLEFDRALLDRPQTNQHPALYLVLRAEAERALERVTAGLRLSDQLRQYLLSRPPSRIPDLSTVARDLGISARSLRRRLAVEATSYRTLVRATLEVTAGRLLRDPSRSIQETAHALGFSDAAAFHRAFKRWTGMTPKEYRAKPVDGASDSDRPSR